MSGQIPDKGRSKLGGKFSNQRKACLRFVRACPERHLERRGLCYSRARGGGDKTRAHRSCGRWAADWRVPVRERPSWPARMRDNLLVVLATFLIVVCNEGAAAVPTPLAPAASGLSKLQSSPPVRVTEGGCWCPALPGGARRPMDAIQFAKWLSGSREFESLAERTLQHELDEQALRMALASPSPAALHLMLNLFEPDLTFGMLMKLHECLLGLPAAEAEAPNTTTVDAPRKIPRTANQNVSSFKVGRGSREDQHTPSQPTTTPPHRGLQSETTCGPGAFQPMLAACCADDSAGDGGHRRAQAGCDQFPPGCTPACAEVFLPFYNTCSGWISKQPGLSQDFSRLYSQCENADTQPSPSPSPEPSQNVLPPLPPGPTPGPPPECQDSETWVSEIGSVGCGQYAPGETSWGPMCDVHRGRFVAVGSQAGAVGSQEAWAQAQAMFSVELVVAAEACPVSCSRCPSCDDGTQNGGETGIDCGGPCAQCLVVPSCGPFEHSGLLGPNLQAICTGQATGDTCFTRPLTGYQPSTAGLAAERCSDVQTECHAQLESMFMIPPADVTPGHFRCTESGLWDGEMLHVLQILPDICPTQIIGNHYSGTCNAEDNNCVATCDDGYPVKRGDGVFICQGGTWIGDLVCEPIRCGITLDKMPVESSAFTVCTEGDTLGSECHAFCREGFYSSVGTGAAAFKCMDQADGLWMQQGFSPWWESSLQCTRCPAIENCIVSSCTTGTDAQCSQCTDGYYAYRHDEEPTRCLTAQVTILTAGYDSRDAAGLFSFTFAGSLTSDLQGGQVSVPSTASLRLAGTGVETLAASFSVNGALTLYNIGIDGAQISVTGGSTILHSCLGNIVGLAATDSTLDVSATSAGSLSIGGSVNLNNIGPVNFAQVNFADAQLTASTGTQLTLEECQGSFRELNVRDGTVDASGSTLTMGDSISLHNVGPVALASVEFADVEIATSGDTQLSVANCHGSLTGLTVGGGSLDTSGNTLTVSGSVDVTTAGRVTLTDFSFIDVHLTASGGAQLSLEDCQGTLGGAAIRQGVSFAVNSAQSGTLTVAGSCVLSGVETGTFDRVSFDAASLTITSSAQISLHECEGSLSTLSASSSALDVPSGMISLGRVELHPGCAVALRGVAFAADAGLVVTGSNLSVHDCAGGALQDAEVAQQSSVSLEVVSDASLSVTGSVRVHDDASFVLSGASVVGVSIAAENNANFTIEESAGSIIGLDVADSTFAIDAASQESFELGGSLSFQSANAAAFARVTIQSDSSIEIRECQLSLSEISDMNIAAISVDGAGGLSLSEISDMNIAAISVDGAGGLSLSEISDMNIAAISVDGVGGSISLTNCEGQVDNLDISGASLQVNSVSPAALAFANITLHNAGPVDLAGHSFVRDSSLALTGQTEMHLESSTLIDSTVTVSAGAQLDMAMCEMHTDGTIIPLVILSGQAVVTGTVFRIGQSDDPRCASYAEMFATAETSNLGPCRAWDTITMADAVATLGVPLPPGTTLNDLCPQSCRAARPASTTAHTLVSVERGGHLSIATSQLVGTDAHADPFPCDGLVSDGMTRQLPTCLRPHEGPVVIDQLAAITPASPLVCNATNTAQCLSDLCLVRLGSACVHGNCVDGHCVCHDSPCDKSWQLAPIDESDPSTYTEQRRYCGEVADWNERTPDHQSRTPYRATGEYQQNTGHKVPFATAVPPQCDVPDVTPCAISMCNEGSVEYLEQYYQYHESNTPYPPGYSRPGSPGAWHPGTARNVPTRWGPAYYSGCGPIPEAPTVRDCQQGKFSGRTCSVSPKECCSTYCADWAASQTCEQNDYFPQDDSRNNGRVNMRIRSQWAGAHSDGMGGTYYPTMDKDSIFRDLTRSCMSETSSCSSMTNYNQQTGHGSCYSAPSRRLCDPAC